MVLASYYKFRLSFIQSNSVIFSLLQFLGKHNSSWLTGDRAGLILLKMQKNDNSGSVRSVIVVSTLCDPHFVIPDLYIITRDHSVPCMWGHFLNIIWSPLITPNLPSKVFFNIIINVYPKSHTVSSLWWIILISN